MRLKSLLFACFALLTFLASAQIIQRPNKTGLGQGWKYAVADSGIVIGTFDGKPPIPPLAIQKEKKAIKVYDSANHVEWLWKPEKNDWDSTSSTGGGTVINNFTDGGANTFTDTIKYFADGSLLNIPFYTPGKQVTGIRVGKNYMGIANGGGFLPESGTIGDSTHVVYSISPQDTIIFIFSGIVFDTNVIEEPTGFIATPLGTSSIALTWNNSAHNNGYQVDYRFTDGTYNALSTLLPDDTMLIHSGLPPDTRVIYRVRALGDTTYYGSNFSFTNAKTAALVVLQTPSITATANSTSQITVEISPVAHASAYELLTGDDGVNFEVLDTVTTTTVVLDSLSSNTQIYFKGRALALPDDTSYANSEYSDTVSATTFAITALATPAITIDSVHSDAIFFHWLPSAGAKSYLIQYSENDTTYHLFKEVDADTTSLVMDNLTPQTDYYIAVTAIADSTNNSNSDVAKDSATTAAEETTMSQLATPSPLTATALNASQIKAQWTNVANETGYRLSISLDKSVWTVVAVAPANTTSYTISGLQSLTKYNLRISATADEVNYTKSKLTSTSATTLDTITDEPHIETIHGALVGVGNTANNMKGLDSLELTNARASYTGNTANYDTYTSKGYNVLFTYSPAVPGDHTALPTDSAQFACTLDSMLTENGTNGLLGVAIINEINNQTYWVGTAANTLNLIRAATTVIHAHGLEAYDGGIATGGNSIEYLVWEDYINRGYPDSAADYAARAFPTGSNPTNWRNSSNNGPKIRLADTLLDGLKTIPTDAVNIHWYETSRPEDSLLSVTNPLTFIQTARYVSRRTGKPVITNEYGLNNNTSIPMMQQQVGAVKALRMKYAFWYSGEQAYSLVNPDGSLTPLGEAYKIEIQKP